MIKIEDINHIAIICSDYECSKRFYTEVLGLRVLRETYRAERNSWKLDLALNGRYTIELFSFPDPPARRSHPEAAGLRHLAFTVENIEETVERLLAQNIACEAVRIDDLTGKKFTFFQDPDGLPLELYEQ